MKHIYIVIVIVYPEISEVEIDQVFDTYTKAYDRKKELIVEWENETYGADVEIISRDIVY